MQACVYMNKYICSDHVMNIYILGHANGCGDASIRKDKHEMNGPTWAPESGRDFYGGGGRLGRRAFVPVLMFDRDGFQRPSTRWFMAWGTPPNSRLRCAVFGDGGERGRYASRISESRRWQYQLLKLCQSPKNHKYFANIFILFFYKNI